MPADFLDRFSRGNTVCHRMPARLKIVLTLSVIFVSIVLPASYWPAQGCLACLVFAALSLAEIPIAYLARRILLILPLVLMTALAAPLSHGFASGWETAFGIVFRTLVAFLAALWLVNTTPFDRLLAGLCRLGMPRLFATLLAFVYRYLFVLFDELARMRTAQRARTFGPGPVKTAWKSRVQLVGTLLIRALDRAERVHGAMCARGWRGKMHSLN
ncbi:MAG TPA: cobalt ECF transporter T component CbiQ [Planctomycetaceae bacterium]|nr:cobalt ECF transporter T component CbiQ [Planctomycetaceae bacterium]